VLFVRAGVEKRESARACSGGGRGSSGNRYLQRSLERRLFDVHGESAISACVSAITTRETCQPRGKAGKGVALVRHPTRATPAVIADALDVPERGIGQRSMRERYSKREHKYR
jgi:hypothetical protein